MHPVIAGFALLLQSAPKTPAAPTPATSPCTGAENRQFDFWLGEWEVRTGDGKLAGTNRIESILGGCALKETWSGTGMKGTSYNAFSAGRGWHQTWIDDHGTLLLLDGGLKGGKMILAGTTRGPKGETRHRITWSREAAGRVRQLWESSQDGGKSWKVLFDGIYTRRRS